MAAVTGFILWHQLPQGLRHVTENTISRPNQYARVTTLGGVHSGVKQLSLKRKIYSHCRLLWHAANTYTQILRHEWNESDRRLDTMWFRYLEQLEVEYKNMYDEGSAVSTRIKHRHWRFYYLPISFSFSSSGISCFPFAIPIALYLVGPDSGRAIWPCRVGCTVLKSTLRMIVSTSQTTA